MYCQKNLYNGQTGLQQVSSLQTSSCLAASSVKIPKEGEISDFMKNNDKKYPPQKPGEAPRPAVRNKFRWLNKVHNVSSFYNTICIILLIILNSTVCL